MRQAALGAHGAVADGSEDAFDGVGRPDMPPVLGREVVEGQQGVAVLCQAGDGLGVFCVVLGGESIHRPLGLGAAIRHPDIMQGSFGGRLSRLRQLVQDIGCLVDPTALAAGVGKDLLQRLPEAQSAIADGELGTNREPAPAQACQQLTPALGALAHPRLEAHEFLASFRRGADEDQNALLLVLQPTLEIDAIGPHVDVASGRQVAPAPALVLGLPLRLHAADHLRRQARGVLAEQRLQRLLEVPAGHATKVERRQNRIQRPRPPRETGQNGRRETDARSSDTGTVPDLRAPHRHRTNASQDRPFRPVAMTHQAPAAVFGLQIFMRRQHGGNLRFNGLCQELASSGAEYFAQRIGRHPWMVQRDNTIFRHGVSLLAWRPGGFVTPHDTPPPSLSPSPTLGHSSCRISPRNWRNARRA